MVLAADGTATGIAGASSSGAVRVPAARVAAYVDLDLVGDALIKLPFVRALRRAYPGAELIWIAGRGGSAYAGALAPLVEGLINRVIERSGVGRGLHAALGGRLDVLIDTQSRVATTLALRLLRPRHFVSAAADFWLSEVRPPPGYRKPRRLVRRLLDLAEFCSGEPARPAGQLQLPAAATALAARLLPAGPTYVAQALGAGGRHKAWPAERHIALARALLATGRMPVMILGPAEHDACAALRAALPEARFPLQEAGEITPALTIALGARCAAAVAADCGAGHMLAASGAPLVSLFGPTDADKFAPWAERLIILHAQAFGGEEMQRIPPPAVLDAVEALLAAGHGEEMP
jgi:ADP-heptose:LPS heptosyltransferase